MVEVNAERTIWITPTPCQHLCGREAPGNQCMSLKPYLTGLKVADGIECEVFAILQDPLMKK